MSELSYLLTLLATGVRGVHIGHLGGRVTDAYCGGMEKAPQRTNRLVCVECHQGSDLECRGWRLYLIREGRELLAYCPGCWAREFGGR